MNYTQELESTLQSAWNSMSQKNPCLKNNLQDKTIILFGLGIGFAVSYDYFVENNIKISFLCDNSPEKQNTEIHGIKVISPKELAALENPFVFILTQNKAFSSQISEQLNGLEVPNVVFDTYVLASHAKEIAEVYNLLNDDRSREVYAQIVIARLQQNLDYSTSLFDKDQYFAIPAFYGTHNKEIFVDLGACVGDTVETFLFNRFGLCERIYCFEPSPAIYKALVARTTRLKNEWAIADENLQCIKAGAGIKTEECFFEERSDMGVAGGSVFSAVPSAAETKIQIYSLDDFFKGDPVSFIKADIEGSEKDMLHGATKTIQMHKPKMALSLYHKVQDLYELPLTVKSICDEYMFDVRHHTYTQEETVLYCYLK